MHPILFRIPLPHMPLKLWWALVAVAVISMVFAGLALRRRDRSGALSAAVVGIAAVAAAYKWKAVAFDAPSVPIYAYGVMLGLSLVVGWYLTLPLAVRDGLPKETMANCYVVTALCALAATELPSVLDCAWEEAPWPHIRATEAATVMCRLKRR